MQTLAPTVFQFNNVTLSVTLDEAKNPWFNANEVCDALGYANPHDALARHVESGGVVKREVSTIAGNQHGSFEKTQEVNFVNETALYELMFGSTLPTAKLFRKWVFDEVLPALRKHGTYTTPQRRKLLIDQAQAAGIFKGLTTTFWKLKTKDDFEAVRAMIDDLSRELTIDLRETRELLDLRQAHTTGYFPDVKPDMSLMVD